MPRQPLSSHPASKNITSTEYGGEAAIKRPKLTKLIGDCLIYWPGVESAMAELLAALLEAESPSAVAVFMTLRRSTQRIESITAAARYTLSENEFELLSAILTFVKSVEAERNALAHGIFGNSEAIQDAILWMSAENCIRFTLDMKQSGDHARFLEGFKGMKENAYFYRESDLVKIKDDIGRAGNNIHSFIAYLHMKRHSRSAHLAQELFCQLSNLAPIAEAIHAMRRSAAQKNGKTPP